MREKIKLLIASNWHILFLVIIGIIIPIHWFADGRIVCGGDHFLYYNPANIFKDYLYSWLERINLGEPNYDISLLFPFLFFFKILKLFGFSTFRSEVLWAIYLFLFQGIFMFFLLSFLSKQEGIISKEGLLVGSIFYMVNPYAIGDLLQIGVRPIHVVFPLLFLLWLKGLENLKEQRTNSTYPILFSFATLLVASSTNAPAFLFSIVCAIVAYTLFFLFSNKELLTKVVQFSFFTIIFCAIFNLWWIVPSLFAFLESGQNIITVISSYNYLRATKIWEAFRLIGHWSFRQIRSDGFPLNQYAKYYYKFPVLFISFIFTVIAFFGLIFKPRNRKMIFFSFLFLLGIFLMKGSNFPLGAFFQYIFNKVPLFSLFRNPYSKFTPLASFSLAVLLGLSWGKITDILPDKQKKLFTLLFLCLIFIGGFPVITGKSIPDDTWYGNKIESHHVTIPNYWTEVGRWFKENDSEARVVLFPKSGYGNTCYNWEMGSCSAEPVGRMFLPNQIIKYPGPEVYFRDSVLNSVYNAVFQNKSNDPSSLLGFLGVKYILQQNDLDYVRASAFSPEKIKFLLTNNTGFKLIKSIGKLDIYTIDEKDIYPWAYATNSISFIDGEATQAGKLIDFKSIKFPQTFFVGSSKDYDKLSVLDEFPSEDQKNIQTEPSNIIAPRISFIRKNPTLFEVKVSEAKDPYYLIFQTSFSKNWKIYLSSGQKRRLPEENHFIVNGFANGWLIKPKQIDQLSNYQIYLEYLPQKYFYYGIFISISGMILSLRYLISKKMKQ